MGNNEENVLLAEYENLLAASKMEESGDEVKNESETTIKKVSYSFIRNKAGNKTS